MKFKRGESQVWVFTNRFIVSAFWGIATTILVCPSGWAAQNTEFSIPWKVEKGVIEEMVILSGNVEPLHSEGVFVKRMALVERLPVNLGQEVKKGDLIAEVKIKFMEYQMQNLLREEDVLKSQLSQARIGEEYVGSELGRLRTLASQEVIAKSQVEEAEISVLDTKIERARAESALHDVQKQIKMLKDWIKEGNYYSPMDGVVTKLLVDPQQIMGAFVANPGMLLARIDRAGFYLAKAKALDTQVARLTKEMSAKVTLEAGGEAFQGQITDIVQYLSEKNEKPVLFEVTVQFEKAGGILGRDISAQIEVLTSKNEPAVVVPWNSVSLLPQQAFVERYSENKELLNQEVVLGSRGRYKVQIEKGLKEGDVVNAQLW